MKALNKTQTEALVDEVFEQIQTSNQAAPLPARISKAWETLQKELEEVDKLEEEMDKLELLYDEAKEKWKNARDKFSNKVDSFENKHNVSVNWRNLDKSEGEKASVEFPINDLKEKIRRQIAILTIDKNGPVTADELIQRVASKFIV